MTAYYPDLTVHVNLSTGLQAQLIEDIYLYEESVIDDLQQMGYEHLEGMLYAKDQAARGVFHSKAEIIAKRGAKHAETRWSTGNYRAGVEHQLMATNHGAIWETAQAAVDGKAPPVLYGAWLEGVSSRNSKQFRGYSMWRTTYEWLETQVQEVGEFRATRFQR